MTLQDIFSQETNPVFGSLSPTTKKILKRSFFLKNLSWNEIHYYFLWMISHYVSLEEAKTGIIRSRAINRFII